MARSDIDMSERLAWRRAWAAVGLGALFVLTQLASLGDPAIGSGPVMHLLAWFVWAALLLVFLAWGSGLFRRRAVSGLINDEGTVDNRRRALGFGFWCAVVAAFAAYWATFYEPIAARDACRLVVTFAIGPALIRFGLLELKALRGG